MLSDRATQKTHGASANYVLTVVARERVILELRYLAFKDWASIADALGLHVRQVYRLHDEALKHIEISGECH